MQLFGDYHTHTRYSDAPSTIQNNIDNARAQKLVELAITDHGFNSLSMGLTRKKLQRQKLEIANLRIKNPDITILHGIEANIIALDGTIDIKIEETKDLDILLCGFHGYARANSFLDWRKFYFNTLMSNIIKPNKSIIARNTATYISAIQRYPIDILTHINNYDVVNVADIAKACADYGTIIEINSKHINLSAETFALLIDSKVTLMANTDAHLANRVGNFDKIITLCNSVGYDIKNLANYNSRPVFRSKI